MVLAGATIQGADSGELGRGADRIVAGYGRAPEVLLADHGFASLSDVQRLADEHGIEVYMPVKDADKWKARGLDPYLPRRGTARPSGCGGSGWGARSPGRCTRCGPRRPSG